MGALDGYVGSQENRVNRFLVCVALAAFGCGDDDVPASADAGPRPDGAVVDCAALPAGPFEPVELVTGLGAAEDIAFDGRGSFVAAGRTGFVRVDGAGAVTPLAVDDPPQFTAGLRYAADGALIANAFIDGAVIAIDADGTTSTVADGLQNPNGVSPARDGTLYVSETAGNRIERIAPGGAPVPIAAGNLATAPNGVVFDEERRALFFAAGLGEDVMTIGRIDIDSAGAPGQAVEVYVGDPGNGDGLALDACGHLYIVDNYRATDADQRRVVRLRLDAAGDAVGAPEVIASFPDSVTNPAFGIGDGFDPLSLYVTGFAGIVYRVPVGVPGAPTAVSP